uniref:Uncharacterized protein n=1 Tax=Noctiluca scintillans TaxID=2966 RepID=A0A7S1FCP5_NOCSC|mmetsp:Transcript_50429/g.134026  ORF Transcript_50429/g.134026 Transcript_50429/m.134026 type:complete len:653 (+) Transcript_50429:74-2032(+)
MTQAGQVLANTNSGAPQFDGSTTEAAPPRRRNKLFTVCGFILVVEMCERLCYYTINGTFRNFLEDCGAHIDQSAATSLSSCFSMLSYMFCLLGGYIADNVLGRYKTIFVFAIVYCVGVCVVTYAAYPSVIDTESSLNIYLLGSFVLVALGTGAIKPNVMNFGAEQYDENDEEERKQQQTFFSYFYLCINVGCVFAYGYTVNAATAGAALGRAGSGFFHAYRIAAGAMLLAAGAFLLGTPRYRSLAGVTRKPMISVIRRHLTTSARENARGTLSIIGWICFALCIICVLAGSLLYSNKALSTNLTWAAFGIACLGCLLLLVVHTNNDFITALPVTEGMMTSGISAADVRQALTCVPAIVCINLGFNVPYNAMNNAYPAQACQMDTVVFGNQLNGAFFTLGDAAAIIIFVPIIEMLIYPALARCRGREATRKEKYTAGFTFCILANVVAAIIEYRRRAMSVSENPDFVLCPEELEGTDFCSATTPSYWFSSCSPGASLPMTNMSAFWGFLPMVLTGLGEIFVNPVIYQYVFENAPASLRSILQALNLVVAGSISNAVTAALGPLIPEDFNTGNLVYYFYVNIVIGVLSLVAFWVIAHVQEIPEAEGRTGVMSSVMASVNHGSALLGQAGSAVGGNGFGSQRRSLLGSTVNSQRL